MNNIKISFDNIGYDSKPKENDIGSISNRIGKSVIDLSTDSIKQYVDYISTGGHSFCPATFKDGNRKKENFEQQQLFTLDFDNKDPKKTVSFGDVKARADHYDLPILFAYDTLSSNNHDKFRVVFMNDVSVTHRKVAEATQLAVGTIFPEADPSCYKDISKMYFGGKGLIYYDDSISETNIESIFRNMTCYFEDRYGPTNTRRHMEKFSRETGLVLNDKGKLDISVVEDISDMLPAKKITKDTGANQYDKNSPSSIIDKLYIIGNGEKLSKRYYILNFGDSSTKVSYVGQKVPGNHAGYRSSYLGSIGSSCHLYREFETGSRRLSHDELFGIATNLIQVESGTTEFNNIIRLNSYYDKCPEKYRKWTQDLKHIKNYKPYSCENFCPHKDRCPHGANILVTASPKRNKIERISGYEEKFDPVEDVEKDVYRAIRKAFLANDNKRYIIKAMTSIGKTSAYLKLMSENPSDRFLIAAPTNILKNEIYDKADKMGINVRKSPSLVLQL